MSFLIVILFAAAFATAPMVEPVCEAKVIADYRPTLTQAQWLEVIDVFEEDGRITKDHADKLRVLIKEAYEQDDIASWVQSHCGQKT